MADNITFFRTQFESVEALPDAEMRANAYKAMFDYAFNGTVSKNIDPISKALLIQSKAIFDKRKEISKKRSEAGSKTKQTETNEEQNETNENKEQTNAYKIKNKNKSKSKNNLLNTSGDEEKEIITLVLDTGDEFSISEEQFKEWQRLYPSVDVLQELRKMKGWCDANPKKRKTKSGIKRFITGWLAREQSDKKKMDDGLPEWYGETTQMPNDPELEKEIEQMMKEVGGIEI